MEEGLFTKHIRNIQTKIKEKDEVCQEIERETGILIESKNITILKKKIIFQTSSVIKNRLLQKNIQLILHKIGYTTKL